MTLSNMNDSRKVKTVEGSNRPNPFPKMGTPPREGNQYPRQIGVTPAVVNGAAFTPILPKGMVGNPGFVDESVNGQEMQLGSF
jgi:hypothetical protein